MAPKVNIKAKIDRHSRILKDNLLNGNKTQGQYTFSYKLVLALVVLVFPLYPSFAGLLYDNTVTAFYRGYIDESSILESYMFQDIIDDGFSTTVLESDDSNYISVNTVVGEVSRNLEGTNEIVVYEVKSGESFDSIADKFGISVNSIYWANDFDKSKMLHPGDKIKIPPVTGLIYKIKRGDTIESIAKEYGIAKEEIQKQNLLTDSSLLIAGEDLVLPGAKPIVKAEPPKQTTTSTKTNTSTSTKTNTSGGSSNTNYSTSDGDYQLVRRAPKRSFARGNCTRFVAQYKNVTWGGNANAWFRNAQNAGVATGYTPKAGSIIVFSGRGYNARYGHVGIVISVSSDSMIIKDMNYRALNEVTTRKIYKNDGAIVGYIYAD